MSNGLVLIGTVESISLVPRLSTGGKPGNEARKVSFVLLS